MTLLFSFLVYISCYGTILMKLLRCCLLVYMAASSQLLCHCQRCLCNHQTFNLYINQSSRFLAHLRHLQEQLNHLHLCFSHLHKFLSLPQLSASILILVLAICIYFYPCFSHSNPFIFLSLPYITIPYQFLFLLQPSCPYPCRNYSYLFILSVP